MGILHTFAQATVDSEIGMIEFYADMADTFPWLERHQTQDGGIGLLAREPVGVVGIIVPWNGPLPVIVANLAPSLLAGCTTIIKSSPEAPGEAYIIAEIAQKVGLPPGVINIVTADREVSELLVRDPRVDKIAFTGSTAAGRRIASILGERIGRATLELGGKSAAVVLDDADISTAAMTLAGAECLMTGQVCASLTRIVVSRSRHDELVEALSANFANVVIGSPFDASSQMGPLAMRRQRDRVEGMIEAGVAQGATLATGGRRPTHLDRGFFIEPTVFGNVDNSWQIAQEEIFGPVLSVIPAENEQDAIRIANDTIYGLNSAVFSPDLDRAYRVSRQLRSGTVGINQFKLDFRIAFGGFKQSGIGREGGVDGLRGYLEAKTILADSLPPMLKE
jgi:acyl-CoA reductase-like NAD-dependent aldehyde dehydrogenase